MTNVAKPATRTATPKGKATALTVKQMKSICDLRGVEYTSKTSKTELKDSLENSSTMTIAEIGAFYTGEY